MKVENEFTVGVPIERAWAVLTDLEGIAPCLPGAQLTGVQHAEGEQDVYAGKVKIKVGPVTSEYAGTAQFVEKDESAYRAVIDAKGKDSRGAGNAAATIRAQLRAEGERTVVMVDTDLNISGKIAQFGSAMIKEVSAKLLGQFAENLEQKLNAPETPAVLPPAEPESSAPRIVIQPEPEALDLMSLAGSSIYKRAIPVAIGAIVIAVIAYLIGR
jgi:carbon monoxide dehydrogenase subunit G